MESNVLFEIVEIGYMKKRVEEGCRSSIDVGRSLCLIRADAAGCGLQRVGSNIVWGMRLHWMGPQFFYLLFVGVFCLARATIDRVFHFDSFQSVW